MLGLFVFKPGGYVPAKIKSSSFIIIKRGNMKMVSDTEDQSVLLRFTLSKKPSKKSLCCGEALKLPAP